ncbi:MAG: hypothetical protein AAGD38_06065 [Acidobacteriota bacterium]
MNELKLPCQENRDHGTAHHAVDRVQDAITEIAVELMRIERRLVSLEESLPMPPDMDRIAEDHELSTLSFDVSGWLSSTREDLVAPAVDCLRRAALRTDLDLRREHRQRKKIERTEHEQTSTIEDRFEALQHLIRNAVANLRGIDLHLATATSAKAPIHDGFDPVTELLAAIETVRTDLLTDAIDSLHVAGHIDKERLRAEAERRSQEIIIVP